MKMLGRMGKPFCGNCCCSFPQGSGKSNKRHLKRHNKRSEKRRAMKDQEMSCT